MRGLCYTCLSQDRNVKILDNVIKSILLEWFEVGAYNFKVNLDEFKVCWECIAWFLKINKFKHQVFTSQKIRLRVAQKKSSELRNLSQLSIYTKNVFDYTYEHIEGSSGLKSQNKSQSNPDHMPSNEGQHPKKKDTRNPENGNHKLSIILRKKKENVTEKHSKASEYDSYVIKGNTTEDNTDVTDSNDNEKDTQKKENGTLDLLSIVNVKDLSEDVKLRSEPYVLLEREKHKKHSNHSKHKHRKRKHGAASEVEKEKAKKHKHTDTTDVGKKTTKFGPVVTKLGPKADNVHPNAGTSKDAAQDFALPDSPEVKFTIKHLNEEQMLATRRIDRDDRLYGNRAFKCETCIIGFLEIGQFEKHIKEKHCVLNGPLVCRICGIRFKKQGFLELHQKTHYRSYKCRQCPFEHHRRYAIEKHVVKVHGLKPSPVCPDCDAEFDTQHLLTIHYETTHRDKLKCNICGDRFDSYARVRKHAAIHKAKHEDCEVKKHTLMGEREIHKPKHEDCEVKKLTLPGHREFDCAHCTSMFLTKEELLAHIVRAHRLLSDTCTLCNKGFSDQIRLKNHMQTKHPEVIPVDQVMDKICQICGKRFSARSVLLDHMRSHTAEKPYQCKMCEKRYAALALLKKHIQRTHQ